MGRITELDGLRAIAVLGVLLAHFTPPNTHVSNLLYLGWAGVDFFFAISGFLITSILIRSRQTEGAFRTFYWRRTLRIFPPYYLALILIVVLALVHNELVDCGNIARHALFLSAAKPLLIKSAVTRLFNHTPSIRFGSPYAVNHSILQFKDCLGVYWSLSVEELFYVIWAPVILKASRRGVLFCSIAPLFVCPILRGLAHTSPYFDETVGFVFRFDSLAAGGCVALMFWRMDQGRLKKEAIDRGLISMTFLSALALFLLSSVCGIFRGVDVRSTLIFSVLGYSLLAVFCASVVGVCARGSRILWAFRHVLRSKIAVYLGTISYTIYLIHLPTYIAIQLAILKLLRQKAPEDIPGFALLCAMLATLATVLLAALSWRYIETPLLRLKEKEFPVRKSDRSAGTAVQAALV